MQFVVPEYEIPGASRRFLTYDPNSMPPELVGRRPGSAGNVGRVDIVDIVYDQVNWNVTEDIGYAFEIEPLPDAQRGAAEINWYVSHYNSYGPHFFPNPDRLIHSLNYSLIWRSVGVVRGKEVFATLYTAGVIVWTTDLSLPPLPFAVARRRANDCLKVARSVQKPVGVPVPQLIEDLADWESQLAWPGDVFIPAPYVSP
jgi:hypothetical protein